MAVEGDRAKAEAEEDRDSECLTERFAKLNGSLLKKSEKYSASLKKEYKKTSSGVLKEIDAFYGRYGAGGNLTFLEANKLLTPKEFADFRAEAEDYIRPGAKSGADKSFLRQLEYILDRGRASRLEILKIKIREQVLKLAANREAGTGNVLEEIYEESYYRTAYEVQKKFRAGAGIKSLAPQTVENALNTPWASDGVNFRKKIQRSRESLLSDIDAAVARSFFVGDASIRRREIEMLFERASAAADRLTITESSHFINESRAAAYAELHIEEYVFIAADESVACGECAGLDGMVFKLADKQEGINYPVIHPNCRCTTAPRFSEDYAAGVMREDGAHEADVRQTYEQWHERNKNRVTYLAENGIIQARGEPDGGVEKKIRQLMSGVWDYAVSSGEQVVLGNYYTGNATFLGTAAQIGLGLLDLDLPADIRDIFYDLTHWKWSWSHAGQTALDAIGLIPVIGVVKNTDEIGAVLKALGKAADETENIGDTAKAAIKAGEGIEESAKAAGRAGDVIEGAGDLVDNRPYLDPNSRPSFRKGVVESTWNNAKGPDGLVRDPNTGDVINWSPGQSRKDIWDMGHVPGQKYYDMYQKYIQGEMTPKQFRDWYNNPNNYRPEIPRNNRGHLFE